MSSTVYLGSERFAHIERDTQAIVIEGPGGRGGSDTLRIPLANAEHLQRLIDYAKMLREIDNLADA